MKAFALTLVLLALAAGCGGGDSGTPSGDPDYSGQVIQVDGTTILVRSDGDPCGIWARTDGTVDVEPGMTVDLYIPGPIAESCPMQGTAEAVVITAPA